MKLARLLDDEFHAALGRLTAQALPMKAAFALKGIQLKIQEELVKYEETRRDTILKFGKVDEIGNLMIDEENNVKFDPEKQVEFINQLNELVSLDVDVGSIKHTDLGDAKITVEDLVTLDSLVN